MELPDCVDELLVVLRGDCAVVGWALVELDWWRGGESCGFIQVEVKFLFIMMFGVCVDQCYF